MQSEAKTAMLRIDPAAAARAGITNRPCLTPATEELACQKATFRADSIANDLQLANPDL